MVRKHLTLVAIKVCSDFVNGPDDSQPLQFCDPVVLFVLLQGPAGIGNGMSGSIWLLLCQHSTQSSPRPRKEQNDLTSVGLGYWATAWTFFGSVWILAAETT